MLKVKLVKAAVAVMKRINRVVAPRHPEVCGRVWQNTTSVDLAWEGWHTCAEPAHHDSPCKCGDRGCGRTTP